VLVSANAGHWWGLVGLVAGILLLDVAVQCNQVANQARIFALDPAARSRLNTVYMTCAFLGGSAGSWVGVQAYTHLGWLGVCALLGAAALLALARHLLPTRARRRPTADSAPAPEITSRT
jgi:predicted MFS family arabinose efflux permease